MNEYTKAIDDFNACMHAQEIMVIVILAIFFICGIVIAIKEAKEDKARKARFAELDAELYARYGADVIDGTTNKEGGK